MRLQSMSSICHNQIHFNMEWIDVNKELPPRDKEVIVLTDILVENSMSIGLGKIAFGHIVDKDRCIDYNGWNIPGVRYWIPCPPIPEL